MAGEPRTEAGKRLLDEPWTYLDRPGITRRILAIEREAAALVLRRIREGVAGLRELSDAATPGPWTWDENGGAEAFVMGPDGDELARVRMNLGLGSNPDRDAAFIVAAVNYIRALLIGTEIGAEP